MSLGRHDPPHPGPGPQVVEADAVVVGHAEHDVADIGAHRLAQVRHGVHETQLGGQEGVGGVLDGLGRGRVGDDAAAPGSTRTTRPPGPPRPGRRHPPRSGRDAGASWMAVPSRRNSGLDTTATSGRSRSRSTRSVEPTGTVDLLTTTAPCSRCGRDLDGHGLEEAHVGGAVGALGGGDAQEDEVGARARPRWPRARTCSRPESSPPIEDVAEALLDDGGLAARQLLHLGRVRLATGHLVPEMGEDDRRGEPDVPGPDHRRR